MNLKKILKKVKSAESAISMLLGVAVVVIVGILLFNYFKGVATPLKEKISPEKAESTKTTQTEENISFEEGRVPPLPAKYTVKSGESLWKISIKFYGSGYNWVDISKENKLKNSELIFNGQELTIPDVTQKIVTSDQKTLVPADEPITGSTYTVVKRDNLWKISVRAYQDGFKWPQIAKANRLVKPALIHPGNILTIPR